MNAIFISFDDGHFHFAKSFLFSLKTNYPSHPIVLINYVGSSEAVIVFLRALSKIKIISLENSYNFNVCHMPSNIIYQRFNLWTEQFSDYENILHLDVDIIVLRSLDHIFDKNEFYICSDHSPQAKILKELQSSLVNRMLADDDISIPLSADSMANAGVFLVPKKYRTSIHYAKLIAIAQKYHKYVAFADQSIISLWCLSEGINFQQEYENNCQIRQLYYKDIYISVSDINILHFSGGAKPGRHPNGILGDDGVTDLDFYNISNEIRYFYRKIRENTYESKELVKLLTEKYCQFHGK